MTRARWAKLSTLGLVGALGLVPLFSAASCGGTPSGGPADASATDAFAGGDAKTGNDGSTAGDDGSSDDATGSDDAGSDDGSDGAGGSSQDDAGTGCYDGCPPGVHCGHFTDPCSGTTYACGTACKSGQVCIAASGNSASQACQPLTCAGACGIVGADGCGVPINCGGCTGSLACVGNRCVTPTVSDAGAATCPPLSCTPSQDVTLCGAVHDGCGNSKSCGTCAGGQECVEGVCTALPPECAQVDGGAKCGQLLNTCGSANVTCSSCAGATKCEGNACVSCEAPACDGRTCGSVNNGCGPAVSCGTCTGTGATCDSDGGCCTPLTCAEALKNDGGAGKGCSDSFDLGCGVHADCVTCGPNQVCNGDACTACAPKTCADFDGGCGHTDNCGDKINCCGAGLQCAGTVCCPANFVEYNGSCCLPACDPAQAVRLQVSCGEVISCPG